MLQFLLDPFGIRPVSTAEDDIKKPSPSGENGPFIIGTEENIMETHFTAQEKDAPVIQIMQADNMPDGAETPCHFRSTPCAILCGKGKDDAACIVHENLEACIRKTAFLIRQHPVKSAIVSGIVFFMIGRRLFR